MHERLGRLQVHQHHVYEAALDVLDGLLNIAIDQKVGLREQALVDQVAVRPRFVDRAAFHRNTQTLQVVGGRRNVQLALVAAKRHALADEVDVAEIDLLASLLRLRDGRNRYVGLAELHSAEQTVEREVVELHLDAEPLADGFHQCDIEAVELEVFVVGFEGRVVGRDAGYQRPRRLDARPGILRRRWLVGHRCVGRWDRCGCWLCTGVTTNKQQAHQGNGQQTEHGMSFHRRFLHSRRLSVTTHPSRQ